MYGVREVSKLLRMPRGTIQGLVRAGFVTPGRGPRKAPKRVEEAAKPARKSSRR